MFQYGNFTNIWQRKWFHLKISALCYICDDDAKTLDHQLNNVWDNLLLKENLKQVHAIYEPANQVILKIIVYRNAPFFKTRTSTHVLSIPSNYSLDLYKSCIGIRMLFPGATDTTIYRLSLQKFQKLKNGHLDNTISIPLKTGHTKIYQGLKTNSNCLL